MDVSVTKKEIRCKKIFYRAHHRGTKEMDLFLGGFVDRALESLDEQELDLLEDLLDWPDPVLQKMVMGTDEIPENYKGLFAKMRLC